jgi:TonB family protein
VRGNRVATLAADGATGALWETLCSHESHAFALGFAPMRSVVSVPAVVVLVCVAGCATARHDGPPVADPAGSGEFAANGTPVANPQGGIDLPQPINTEISRDDCPGRPSGGIAYPRQAADARFNGTVVLKIVIDATGRVRRAVVIKDPGHGLGEAAVLAVCQHFRFKPAEIGGKPVASESTFTIDFAPP